MAESFQKILDNLGKEASYQMISIISRPEGIFLGQLVEKYRPKNILEIGTGIGYSTLFLASTLPPSGKIYTCEIDFAKIQICQKAFENAGLTGRIENVLGNVFKTIPDLKVKFDLVFIDAAHDDYYKYLHLIKDKLVPEAVIVVAGAGKFAKEMENYLAEVRNSGKYHSRFYQFGSDGLEVSIKKGE